MPLPVHTYTQMYLYTYTYVCYSYIVTLISTGHFLHHFYFTNYKPQINYNPTQLHAFGIRVFRSIKSESGSKKLLIYIHTYIFASFD